MVPTLYILNASPGVRAVLITANALELKLNQRELNLINEEHLHEDFLKLNPLHTVPTLDDNGTILYDSHVINAYIIEKYGKDESLYPKDLYKRCLVQQGTSFDLGYLFPVLKEIDVAYYKKEITSLTPRMVEMTKSVYELLETILKRNKWVAYNNFTVADISCYTTITSLDYHVSIKAAIYPNIVNWIQRCTQLPCFKDDFKNLEAFYDYMKAANAKPYQE